MNTLYPPTGKQKVLTEVALPTKGDCAGWANTELMRPYQTFRAKPLCIESREELYYSALGAKEEMLPLVCPVIPHGPI